MSLDEIRDRILASRPGGTLRIYGDWFGRPHDNVHTVVSVVVQDDSLLIEFDEDEALTITRPSGLAIDGSAFRIERADRVRWEWYSYGKPKVAAHRYWQEHWLEGGDVRAASNVDWYVPEFDPQLAFPAVELLSRRRGGLSRMPSDQRLRRRDAT